MTYRSLGAILAAGALCACVGQIDGTVDEELDITPLEQELDEAAEAYQVPVEILAAVGYVETGWEMVDGHTHDGSDPASGVMALRGERLLHAAELAGEDPEDVRHEVGANLRAAAALLDHHARTEGIDRSDLAAWAVPVALFSGIADDEARARYVIDGVYATLREGVSKVAEDGTLIASIEAVDVVPDYPVPDGAALAGGDYAGAIWRPSPNYNGRPAGSTGKPAMVVIHTCEGGYAGCWGWLRNSAAGASAHYVVKENGAEVTQLVAEANRAWHIAASYECSRNRNVDCWRNGVSSNHFTIGIEHAGFASQSSFPNGQLEASAKLVCDITRRHGIPRDRQHIIGHGQMQPWNRTDPGANWPWDHYISRVRAHCGDGGGGGGTPGGGGSGGAEIVVDSNNSRNDSALARVEVSSTWTASNATPGHYGTGYWWAPAEPISDGASFWFYLDTAGTRTIDAWWTAGSNRSTAAPFVAFDASGRRLGTVHRNQQIDGKRWVTLGTWSFTKGWNRVVLSRWTSSAGVVIADAIRVR